MSAPPSPTAASPATAPLAEASGIVWSEPQRAAEFDAWLSRTAPAQGLLPHTLRLASADASFRRYFRIDRSDGAGSRIVMDAPPHLEDSAPFVRIAGLMTQAGVRAPRVLDWDPQAGFMLLDDLGHQTLLDVLDRERPEANRARFEEAIEALIKWQLASRPDVLPPYDRALLERELALFPEWYIGRHRGVAVEGRLRERLERAFASIVAQNLGSASVFVHRDFMPRNLMIASDPPGLGVLDFQDATYGPISYDIASLMRDAFVSWEEDFVLDVTVRYWQSARKAGLPVDDDFGSFYRAVEWMGLQRHLKVAGIFARLTLRDGKPKYLADAPRFIGYIRTTASRYQELTPLLRVIDEVEGSSAATGFAFGRV